MEVIKPPTPLEKRHFKTNSVFLAGSIEMGKAIDWQKNVEEELINYSGIIFNPRRDDWDSSWEQKIENDQFRFQVNWEITALNNCSLIIMYLAPDTISPISLLELGLHAKDNKLIVCCPDEFQRKGNVEIVCRKYGITMVENLEKLIAITKLHLQSKNYHGRESSII